MYELTRYRKVTFAILTAILLISSFLIALPFWQAIGWGCVLALISYPLHIKLRNRFSNSTSALLTTLIVIFSIAIPLVFVGFALTGEAKQIQQSLSNGSGASGFSFNRAVDDANQFVAPFAESFGIEKFDVKEVASGLLQPALNSAPQTLERLVKGVIIVIFAFILLFFVLRDGHKLREPVYDLIPMPREKTRELLSGLFETLHATFQGIMFVAAIQGFLLGITFWALGLPAPTVAGIIGFILCTIPFAGAPVLWVPSALILALQDKWVEAVILVVVGVLVIGLVDNLLRPVIIGARTKLHTAAVFFSIVGGLFALGSIGIFVGPLLITAMIGVADIPRETQRKANEASA